MQNQLKNIVLKSNTWDLNQDGKLQIAGSGAFSQYTTEMTALNNLYRTKNSNLAGNRQVLFAVNAADEANTNLAGDMPLASQFGYLICENITADNIARTAAHEIARGLFQLRHIWEYDLDKGSTDNLMDYATGTRLIKFQWDEMFDKREMVFPEFQEEDVGKEVDLSVLNWATFTPETDENSKTTFLSPSGLPITLKGTVNSCWVSFNAGSFQITDYSNLTFDPAVPYILDIQQIGAVYGFILNGYTYYPVIDGVNNFKGYYCPKPSQKTYYIDTETYYFPESKPSVMFIWNGNTAEKEDNKNWKRKIICIKVSTKTTDFTKAYMADGIIPSNIFEKICDECNNPPKIIISSTLNSIMKEDLKLQSSISMLSGKTFARTIQSKLAGGLLVAGGAGVIQSFSIATDQYGNIGIVYAEGGFADLLSGIVSSGNNIKNGNFELGFEATTAGGIDYLFGYETVMNIAGYSHTTNFTADALGTIDVAMISGSDEAIKGISGSAGFGLSYGIGSIASNSLVFAFTFKDFDEFFNTFETINKDMESDEINSQYYDFKISHTLIEEEFKNVYIELKGQNILTGNSETIRKYKLITLVFDKDDNSLITTNNVYNPKNK